VFVDDPSVIHPQSLVRKLGQCICWIQEWIHSLRFPDGFTTHLQLSSIVCIQVFSIQNIRQIFTQASYTVDLQKRSNIVHSRAETGNRRSKHGGLGQEEVETDPDSLPMVSQQNP